jgi:signal transduction histidine kinase
MNSNLSLIFLIASIIQMGMMLTVFRVIRTQDSNRQIKYWSVSLLLSVLAFLSFLVGLELPLDSTGTNSILFIANIAYISSAISQTLFCLSLTKKVSKYWVFAMLGIFIIFVVFFYQYRSTGNFVERSVLVGSTLSLTYLFQLRELFSFRNQEKSNLLKLLAFTNLAELLVTIARIVFIMGSNLTTLVFMQDVPAFISVITSIQVGLNVLSYLVGSGYWVERISIGNAKVAKENAAIQNLLNEKNDLIYSLIATRKIAESGALAATIAHEINQPLGVVQLNAQYLQNVIQKKVNDPLVDRLLENIVNDNKRAAEIVKTLRSLFTSIDRQLVKISMDEMILSLESVIKPRARDLNVEIKQELHAPIELTVNPGEIQQVLLNLFNNAFDVLEREDLTVREITIKTQQVGDSVTLIFEDSGPGVPLEMQAHLFDLMKSDKSSGMGVGLWLSKYIVEHHQGSISYISKPGLGASFLISLPIEPKVSNEDVNALIA